ncbi:hypothetical protein F3157_20180 [Virgibacillus dakarensis]|nr:hypothetical protein [Virgibacillus dakarensis]
MQYAPKSTFLMVFVPVLAAVIHFILYVAVGLYLDKRKDRHFVKEYNQILEAYNETDNAEIFLHDLSNIKNPPKTAQSANAFNFSMSTALYKNNRKEEALSYLYKVNTSDNDLQKVIEEQRKMIEDGEVTSI